MDDCIALVYMHKHACMHCVTRPTTIISSLVGKLVVKPDHWWQYCEFHTISWCKKIPTIRTLPAFKLILTFVNMFNSLWGLLTHFQSSSFITLSMPTFSISPIIRLSLWYLSQSHCESFPIIHTHSHWKADTQFTIPEWVGGWVAVCVCRWRLWRVLPVRSLSDGVPRWQSAEMCRRRQSECHWTKHRVSATLWAGEIQHASLAHSYFLVLYMSTR